MPVLPVPVVVRPQEPLPAPPQTVPPAPIPSPNPVPSEVITDGSPTTPGTLLDAPRNPRTGGVVVLPPSQALGAPPSLARPESLPVDDTFPFPEDERGKVYVETAKIFRTERGNPDLYIAEGDVVIRYNGYRAYADRATVDRNTRMVTLEGRTRLETARQTVYADYIELNTDTRDFTARQARTIIPPDLVGPNLQQLLYLEGETITRTGRVIVATNGRLTTCEFPLPHYRFAFARAQVIPNDRVILRNTSFYRYNNRVFTLKYLTVPIRDDIRTSFTPQVGRTEEEGYFIKSAFGYALTQFFPGLGQPDYPGLFRVDLMEKKGIGLGIDQAYRFADVAAGTFVFYGLNDRSRNVTNTNGRVSHLQRVGEVDISVTSDFQNNSYYAATQNSKTQNSTLSATRFVGPSSTTITYNLGKSDLQTSVSDNSQYTITQEQRFGQNFRVRARFNGSDQNSSFTSLTSSTTSGRTEQNGDLTASGRVGIFDLDLQANRSFAARLRGTSSNGNFFSGTERLPEFTLRTTGERIGGNFTNLPLNFALGFGRFVENPGRTTTSRALIDIDGSRTYSLAPRNATSFTMNGGLRQYLYEGGDAAQYVLESSPQFVQRIGRDATYNLNYSYLRPYGGAPLNFRLDSIGSNNNLGTSLNVQSYRTRLSLLTGFDIQRSQADITEGQRRNPWQNLSAQLALRPSPIFQTRFTSTYDLNNAILVDATNRIRVRAPGGFAFDSGLRYDPRTKKFPQITSSLETPLFGDKANFTAFAGYNGVTKKFDYRSFALTRILHDYEITLRYIDQPFGFRTEKGFSFTIRLKALPGAVFSNTGQYGTPLDTGTGEVF